MDSDTVRARRLASLEEKKERLAKLRAERENRAKEKEKSKTTSNTVKKDDTDRADVDALVDSLLAGSADISNSPSGNENHDADNNEVKNIKKEESSEPITNNNDTIKTTSSAKSLSSSNVTLTLVPSIVDISIPPKRIETYEKEIQTEDSISSPDGLIIDTNDSNIGAIGGIVGVAGDRGSFGTTGGLSSYSPRNKNNTTINSATSDDENDINEIQMSQLPPEPPKKLTEDELSTIVNSDNFKDFLQSSSHMMNKLLGITSSYNGDEPIALSTLAFKDYAADEGQEVDEAIMNTKAFFEDNEGWLATRPILGINISPHHSELFCVAYGSQASWAKFTNNVHNNSNNALSSSGSNNTLDALDNNSNNNINNNNNNNNNNDKISSTSKTEEEKEKERELQQQEYETSICFGAVGLWSYANRTIPEYRLAAHVPVRTACFHPFDARVILGGCEDGTICVWDLTVMTYGSGASSNKSTKGCEPTLKSSLIGKGHKYPIRSIHVIGTTNNYEMVSVCAEGMVCHWDLSVIIRDRENRQERKNERERRSGWQVGVPDVPLEPIRSTYVRTSRNSSSSSSSSSASQMTGVDVASVALAQGIGTGNAATRKLTRLFVGSSMGSITEMEIPLEEESICPSLYAHNGGIMGAAMHPHDQPSISKLGIQRRIRDLLLTCSADWTVKLWSVSDPLESGNNSSDISHDGASPLAEFRSISYEYVTDVEWSPINPSVFATVSCGGEVTIWDLVRSTTDATAVLKLSHSIEWEKRQTELNSTKSHNKRSSIKSTLSSSNMNMLGQIIGSRATNCLRWTTDGRALLVGDSFGVITVVNVMESHALPRAGDDSRLEVLLLQLMKSGRVNDLSNGNDKGHDGSSGSNIDEHDAIIGNNNGD